MVGEFKLIVEMGATKTDWRLCGVEGSVVASVSGRGFNLAVSSRSDIEEAVREPYLLEASLRSSHIVEVWFYGAGCVSSCISSPGRQSSCSDSSNGLGSSIDRPKVDDESGMEALSTTLLELYPEAVIHYESDMMAAARAICGHEKGIVAILGTGSNSCLYDGKKIVKNIRPGGFILGDEGSAAALGKLFLADYIKGMIPEGIAMEFVRTFNLDKESSFDSQYMAIVNNVYKSDAPSRYLGGIAPFLISHIEDEYVRGLVRMNFRTFFERSLLRYWVDWPVGVVGSFGCACESILREVGEEMGLNFGRFMASPADGLVAYHGRK